MPERLSIPDGAYGGRPYRPPLPGGEPRLYALLAVEAKPRQIVYFHLELDHHPGACTIDLDREAEQVNSFGDLDPVRLLHGPTHVTATISGIVVSNDPGYRPPYRDTAPQPEIGAAPAELNPGPS